VALKLNDNWLAVADRSLPPIKKLELFPLKGPVGNDVGSDGAYADRQVEIVGYIASEGRSPPASAARAKNHGLR